MQTTIHLTEEELSLLKDFTHQADPSQAVRMAMNEYIRYVQRMQLKTLSGKVEVQDNWQDLENSELNESQQDHHGSGSD